MYISLFILSYEWSSDIVQTFHTEEYDLIFWNVECI